MANITEKIKTVEEKYLKKDLPDIRIGDYVKMRVRVAEADKVRVHPWEGNVVRKGGSGTKASFTVRKISYGEGVERTFPVHSPTIETIDVVTRGHVRRSKLYYLRGKLGKKAKVKRRES